MLFIYAFFVSPIFRFSTYFVVNHVPDTAFPTWILLHFSFDKKIEDWSELFVGSVLHTSATRVRVCKYTVYPIFMLVI
jgi:hypothetical protein